jgi:hypothetical protein
MWALLDEPAVAPEQVQYGAQQRTNDGPVAWLFACGWRATGAASDSLPNCGMHWRSQWHTKTAHEYGTPNRSAILGSKKTRSRRPPAQPNRMPSVGRSSDSRASREAGLLDRRGDQWPSQNASRILLDHSGGAVPEFRRVPCSSAAKTRATDHQRTSNAGQSIDCSYCCKAPRRKKSCAVESASLTLTRRHAFQAE